MPITDANTPGHCNDAWFDQPGPVDPWILSTDQPLAWWHRDAPIGNGLFGTRVNPWGDATGYHPGSCSFMHGMWGKATENPDRPEGLIELPHWATLAINDGDKELRRLQGELTGHCQSLDLKTATVNTRYQIDGSGARIAVDRETWIARADQHLAVLEARITVHDGSRLFIDEYLDAMHWPDMHNPAAFVDGEDLCLSVTSMRHGHQLATSSRLLFEGVEPDQIRLATSCCGAVAKRRVQLSVRPGQIVRVVKVVALVGSPNAATPLSESRRVLAEACHDLPAVRTRHEQAWAQLWQSRIETDHPRLQQICNASLFHLYTTLRDGICQSHGPCGLVGNGWDSLVFWDTDLWTLPIYALFNPDMAKSCVAYRYRTLPGARANADLEKEAGARYAWMSGQTGTECCSQRVFQEERHIVSCVALAQWLYIVASGDRQWREGPGLQVIRNCADYWVSRAEFDEADEEYHIRNVCGPDEHARFVDDNATTNWGAVWTLRLADRLVREIGGEPDPHWTLIAEKLHIPWDEERDIPKQMAQWQHGQKIKQADATLLIHPWRYPMPKETARRVVDYYREHYPENQIMMGVAIDGVIDCQLQRPELAMAMFRKLLPHFRKPYLTVSEAPGNDRINFLTGLGGLLQMVCMGFAGLSADDDEQLTATPCLPEALNTLKLIGVHHGGKQYNIQVHRNNEGQSVACIQSAAE